MVRFGTPQFLAFDLNQCFDKSWAYPFHHRLDIPWPAIGD
jgi:hypothetical protein